MAKPILIKPEVVFINAADAYLEKNSHNMDARKVEVYNWLRNSYGVSREQIIGIAGAVYGKEQLLPVSCDGCGKYFSNESVVQVGEASDWDSSTARLCRRCLVEALELFKEN